MTPSVIEIEITPDDQRIAWLTATAVGLSLVDAAIPLPVPGIKPGLANIVTLLVLARFDWQTAVWVSLLRVVVSSILLGQFLAPGFFLGLSGAITSLGLLFLAYRLPQRWFSPVSWSVLAAFAHIAGQIVLARLWLIPHDGVFYLLPLFALMALIFGTLNGLIVARLLTK